MEAKEQASISYIQENDQSIVNIDTSNEMIARGPRENELFKNNGQLMTEISEYNNNLITVGDEFIEGNVNVGKKTENAENSRYEQLDASREFQPVSLDIDKLAPEL